MSRLAFCLPLVAALASSPSPARADDKPRVALVPLSGAAGPRADAAIVSAIGDRATVEKIAAPKKGEPPPPGYAALINGGVLKTRIAVEVKLLASGANEVITIPIVGGKPTDAALTQVGARSLAALDRLLKAAPPPARAPLAAPDLTLTPAAPPPVAAAPPEAAPTPEASAPPPPPDASAAAQRPEWAPFVEGSVGFALSGRQFAFDQPGLPGYSSALTPGLRFDVTGFPVAFLAKRGGLGWSALSGLGLGLTYDTPFWGDANVSPCIERLPSGECRKYPTSEGRIEAGLRWRWSFLRRPDRPQLLASIQYGHHYFRIGRGQNPDTLMPVDIGPPEVAYHYATFGLGARYPFLNRFAAQIMLHLHAIADSGPIQTAPLYGPGSSWGARVNASFDARVWRSLFVGLQGSFEHIRLSFGPRPDVRFATPPCPCVTTGGATDQYYGIGVHAGYSY